MKTHNAIMMKPFVFAVSALVFVGGAFSGEKSVRKRHLFLDPGFAAVRENVTIAVNPPRSREIVIRRDTPVEAHMIALYLTVIDEGDKIRMWYTGRSKPGKAHGAYAESTDGVHWEKPYLGQHDLNGNKENNIFGDIAQEGSIFRDPHAKSDEERYVFISSLHQRGGVFRYTSPDGIRNWKMDKESVMPFECDSQNVCFWDDNIKKYVLYLRAWNQPKPGLPTGRNVVRYETDDLSVPYGIVQTNDKGQRPKITDELPTVLIYDEKDPPYTDVYTNAIQPYPVDPTWYLGFPAMYRLAVDSKHENDGRLEVQFISSRDGIRWERYDRAVYAGPGLTTDKDANMIFMGVGMIVRGDEIWQYATGFETTHGDIPERVKSCDGVIYRYVQRIDGFVSLDFPNMGEGRCTTGPVSVVAPKMLLNLDAGALGELKVGILDENGNEIPGFGHSDCASIQTNDTGYSVTWKNKKDLDELLGKKVRIEFIGTRTKLYSIRFEKP